MMESVLKRTGTWALALFVLAMYLTTAQSAPCTAKCAKDWNRCQRDRISRDGTVLRKNRNCCNPDFQCVQSDDGYAQCRPKRRAIPQSWGGAILKCDASSAEQLPQLTEWGAECGASKGACGDPYPCCSAAGKCGCTSRHCGAGCQASFGKCGSALSTVDNTQQNDFAAGTPSPTSSSPSDDADASGEIVPGIGREIAPPNKAVTVCGRPWVQAAIAENNKRRAEVGAGPLTCDESAARVSVDWSMQMCQKMDLSHDNMSSRCDELGDLSCAENVLFNYNSEGEDLPKAGTEAAIQWYNSAPHQANMLNSRYTKVGYGYYLCKSGRFTRVYWTGMYGA